MLIKEKYDIVRSHARKYSAIQKEINKKIKDIGKLERYFRRLQKEKAELTLQFEEKIKEDHARHAKLITEKDNKYS